MPPLDEMTPVDALNIENVKNIAGQSAVGHARHNATQTAHLARLELMAEAELAANTSLIRASAIKGVELLLTTDVSESVGLNKLATGNDVASQMQALLAALNSGQQGVKSAQTTPPETGQA